MDRPFRSLLWVLALSSTGALGACRTPLEEPQRPLRGESESGWYLVRGDEVLHAGNILAAEASYQRAVDAAVRERHNSNLVEALAQLAEVARLVGKLETAEDWLIDAEQRASDEEPLGWSRLLLVRAQVDRDAGRAGGASAVFASLFDYCVQHELFDRALDTAHRLVLRGDYHDKVAWAERGLALAEELGDERWQAVLWNNLGWAHNDAQERESALRAFLDAREFYQRTGTELQRLAADYSVGRAYRLVGDIDEALAWITPTYRQAEKRYANHANAKEARWFGLCQLELAELAALLGQRNEAVDSFRRAHALLTEAGAEGWWPEGLRKIEERLDELTGPRVG